MWGAVGTWYKIDKVRRGRVKVPPVLASLEGSLSELMVYQELEADSASTKAGAVLAKFAWCDEISPWILPANHAATANHTSRPRVTTAAAHCWCHRRRDRGAILCAAASAARRRVHSLRHWQARARRAGLIADLARPCRRPRRAVRERHARLRFPRVARPARGRRLRPALDGAGCAR
jgi:hypothetical protein